MSGTYLSRAQVEAAYVVFSTIFSMKLKHTPTVYERIATVITGVSERVEFKWMAELPIMKKWLGDRALTKLRGEGTALVPEWWANGLECDVDDLMSDAKLGLIMPFIREMARMGGARMDQSVIEMYTAGTAATYGTTYDGQFLYDTDHTAAGSGGGTSQSNVISGAFGTVAWNAALQRGMEFKDSQGEPIGATPSLVFGGPAQQLAFRTLFDVDRQAGGADNVDKGTGKYFISPRISSTPWFTVAEEVELRPVLIGVQAPVEFVSADDPRAVEMFMRRTALYGAHVKFGVCYGFWQTTMRSPGT
jgi:phage major head subunit gpT-like protein